MAIIYRVREIEQAGQPTGKFRMTEASDESSDSTIFGLCEHEHGTQDEAKLCPVVVAKLARIFPPMPACPKCDELTKRIAELEHERDEAQEQLREAQEERNFLKKEVAGMWHHFYQGGEPPTIEKIQDLASTHVALAELQAQHDVMAQQWTKVLNERDEARAMVEELRRDHMTGEELRAINDLAEQVEPLKARVDELHAEAMKVVTCAKSFGWSPLYHDTSPDEAVKFLKRQLESEKRFAGDLNAQTAKQAQDLLHLRTSNTELREAIKLLEPDMDHDHHTLLAAPKLYRRYVDEYLYPAVVRLNSHDVKHVFEPLTFEDWQSHQYDPDK